MEELRHIFADARSRVPGFARQHFGVLGTLRLHASIIGLDLIRGPINLFMSAPALFARLGAMLLRLVGARRAAGWIDGLSFFLPTRIAMGLTAHIQKDLLQASLIEGLLRQADMVQAEAFKKKLDRLVSEYLTARTAMAEFAAAVIVLLTGLVIYGAATPGAFTLAPFVADNYAQEKAIEGFALGSWAGSVWYGYFPQRADWELTFETAMGIMVAMAFLSTIVGLVIDPIQRWLGMHERRLMKLVLSLERSTLGDKASGMRLPDTFLPRLMDISETVIIMTRLSP